MHIDVGIDASNRLVDYLNTIEFEKTVLVVSDLNTYAALGERAISSLKDSGFDVKELCLKREHQVCPDKETVDEVLSFASKYNGILIAVGSGAINDLVRRAASVQDKKYISLATAPSMDGYASVISALTVNNVKKTFYGKPPFAIFADTEVISKAPRKMVMAGYGDMLAKIVSIADWKLGVALCDEVWNEEAANMSINARDAVLKNTKEISAADKSGIHALTEALINSGRAIILAGQTRPASGAEHHIAHFLEMKLAIEKRPEILHGIKVGLGTLCSIFFFNALRGFDPENIDVKELADKLVDNDKWTENIKKVFGPIAAEIIEETDGNYRKKELLEARLLKIKKDWAEKIKPIIEEVPLLDEVMKLIEMAKFDYSPESLGFTKDEFKITLLNSMEVRPRYSVLRLLSDLGRLDELTEKICEFWY